MEQLSMTPFLQLVLALTIIIVAAKAGGWLAVRFHQPAVLGELLAGVLLGPSLLDILHWPLLTNPAEPHLLTEAVYSLAELGVVLLMFLAGMEVDVGEMRRSGRVATFAGVGGVLAPLALGTLAALPFGYPVQAAFFVGMILTATSVSISAQTLLELGLLRSREGLALLSAAVVDDILVILLLSVFVAVGAGGAGPLAVGVVFLRMVVFLALAGAVAFLLLPRLAAWIDGQPISEGLTVLALVAILVFAWTAEVAGGLAAITGAFIAGLGLGRSNLHAAIRRSVHTITYAFFVPIFFVSIGLQTNARLLAGQEILFALVLVVVAAASKVLGGGAGARLGGLNNREAMRVGVGMISRGEVGLIVATVGVDAGVIRPELFSVVTIIVLITTLITPPLLRLAFGSKEISHA
jgi:Kef-type K+ transport system membrane component KefB